jgi:hypothetical protein
MKSFFPYTLWPAAALLLCAPALATRPMVVDDASITAPGNCQLETWTQHTPGQIEYWAAPACNVGGSWELTAGAGRVVPGGLPRYGAGVVQAKTVFRPLQTNDWGIGLTVADQFRLDGKGSALSVLVPMSASLLSDRVLVHANLGWVHQQEGGRDDPFWAIGTEWTPRQRMTLTLEAYGTGNNRNYAQAGLRVAVIPDRLALDAGVGDRIGHFGAERYYTIGLTLAGPVRH